MCVCVCVCVCVCDVWGRVDGIVKMMCVCDVWGRVGGIVKKMCAVCFEFRRIKYLSGTPVDFCM